MNETQRKEAIAARFVEIFGSAPSFSGPELPVGWINGQPHGLQFGLCHDHDRRPGYLGRGCSSGGPMCSCLFHECPRRG